MEPTAKKRVHDLTETDLSTPGVTFQIGLPPLRIDILTAITGVDFEEAWPDRMQTKFAEVARTHPCIWRTARESFKS